MKAKMLVLVAVFSVSGAFAQSFPSKNNNFDNNWKFHLGGAQRAGARNDTDNGDEYSQDVFHVISVSSLPSPEWHRTSGW